MLQFRVQQNRLLANIYCSKTVRWLDQGIIRYLPPRKHDQKLDMDCNKNSIKFERVWLNIERTDQNVALFLVLKYITAVQKNSLWFSPEATRYLSARPLIEKPFLAFPRSNTVPITTET